MERGKVVRGASDARALDTFDAQLAINLRAAFCLARNFLPRMDSAGGSRFIAVGSVAGEAESQTRTASTGAEQRVACDVRALAATLLECGEPPKLCF